MKNPNYFLSILSMMVGSSFAIQILTIFELDEKVHCQKKVVSMRVSIRKIVMSKYILTFILAVLAGMIMVVTSSLLLEDPVLYIPVFKVFDIHFEEVLAAFNIRILYVLLCFLEVIMILISFLTTVKIFDRKL